MKNYYSTVDGIVTTFSDVSVENFSESIIVRFERNIENCFAFAEYRLPSRTNIKCCGFSEDELFDLEDYLICNESLIWELAKEVRVDNMNTVLSAGFLKEYADTSLIAQEKEAWLNSVGEDKFNNNKLAKNIVLEWDPDFTKLTKTEAERLKKIEETSDEWCTGDDINID